LKPLKFHPAALQEIHAAHDRYAEQSPKAADGFLAELLLAFDRIRDWPHLYPAAAFGTQRSVLSRYPFSIVYRDLLIEIQIVAVAHAKRLPGYWAGRL
jgi:plasmid stabilization system protein ParE